MRGQSPTRDNLTRERRGAIVVRFTIVVTVDIEFLVEDGLDQTVQSNGTSSHAVSCVRGEVTVY